MNTNQRDENFRAIGFWVFRWSQGVYDKSERTGFWEYYSVNDGCTTIKKEYYI